MTEAHLSTARIAAAEFAEMTMRFDDMVAGLLDEDIADDARRHVWDAIPADLRPAFRAMAARSLPARKALEAFNVHEYSIGRIQAAANQLAAESRLRRSALLDATDRVLGTGGHAAKIESIRRRYDRARDQLEMVISHLPDALQFGD